MSGFEWVLIGFGVALAVYAACVVVLVLVGRGSDARAVARFVPDCVVLFRRLLGDPRVPRRRKALVVALVGYLAMPFDLVPDFIPVAGQLDDAILVVVVLRLFLRADGAALVREHWPGPRSSLDVVLRLAYGRNVTGSAPADFASQRLAPLIDRDSGDPERDEWVQPPKTEQRVRQQADQHRDG